MGYYFDELTLWCVTNEINMRKLLICFKFLLATFGLYSQATCSNPDVITGDGTYNALSGLDYKHWFTYTNNSGASKVIEVSTVGLTSIDTYIEVHTDCSGSRIAFNDDFGSEQARVVVIVEDGEAILINMSEYGQDNSFDYNFSINLSDLVEGGSCASAQSLDSSGIYRATSTIILEKWFAYTNETSITQEIEVSTVGLTSIDTYIEIYENCQDDAVDFNDDYVGSQAQITRNVSAGETVLIKMTEYDDDSFDFDFSFSIDGEVTALASSDGTYDSNMNLFVFPNPVADILTVSTEIDESLEVFDAQGNIYSVQFSGNQLNVSGLASGVYFIKQGNQVVSFIKS